MSLNELRKEIEFIRGKSPYSYWVIGITDDPEQRRKQHNSEGKNTKYWHHWKAESELVAVELEKEFRKKGMKGAEEGSLKSTIIYMF
jgi:predicted GIY-YIG superfamily endonuclease